MTSEIVVAPDSSICFFVSVKTGETGWSMAVGMCEPVTMTGFILTAFFCGCAGAAGAAGAGGVGGTGGVSAGGGWAGGGGCSVAVCGGSGVALVAGSADCICPGGVVTSGFAGGPAWSSANAAVATARFATKISGSTRTTPFLAEPHREVVLFISPSLRTLGWVRQVLVTKM